MTRRRSRLADERIESVESALARPVESILPVAGGDIAESFRIEIRGGDKFFLKDYGANEARTEESAKSRTTSGTPPTGPADAEAQGLEWLRSGTTLRVPEVIACTASWLALEWIESAPRRADFGVRLGHGLAELHAAGAPTFGLETANWIGRLPQRNEPRSTWAAFLAENRWAPMIERAKRTVGLPTGLGSILDRLLEDLPELLGPEEPPSRLHGDLWSGNVLADETGSPCLIDPAVYGGHREVDLAMLALFGGLDANCERAYAERAPLSPGFIERRPLYQVYPLLVHVCLFGGGYFGQLESACRRAMSRA